MNQKQESEKVNYSTIGHALSKISKELSQIADSPQKDQNTYENPFSKYPSYLKASDITDMLQVSKNKAYDYMRDSGLILGNLGKNKRVPRDKFVKWLLDQEGKSLTEV